MDYDRYGLSAVTGAGRTSDGARRRRSSNPTSTYYNTSGYFFRSPFDVFREFFGDPFREFDIDSPLFRPPFSFFDPTEDDILLNRSGILLKIHQNSYSFQDVVIRTMSLTTAPIPTHSIHPLLPLTKTRMIGELSVFICNFLGKVVSNRF